MNVLAPIARRALLQPEAPALVAGERSVSYGRLMRDVATVAARLSEEGVRRRQVVAIAVDDLLPHVLLTLAVARVGAISIPFWPMRPEVAVALARTCDVRLLVHNQPADSPTHWPAPSQQLSLRELLVVRPRATLPMVVSEPGELFRIAFSSGTTGSPKAVKLTHDALVVRTQLLQLFAPSAPTDRTMITLAPPLQFAVGHWLCTLATGGAVVSAPASPQDTMEAIRTQAVSFLLTSPGTAVELLQQAQSQARYRQPAPALKTLCIGGARIAPPLQELLRGHLCRNLVINYGMAEAGGLVAQADDALLRSHPASAGRLQPWVELQAVDDAGAPLPPGSQGRLRIRSPYLADGYLGTDPEATQAFRDGWFHSRDIGMVTPDGLVYLRGRADVLNVAGNKISPEHIEAVIAQDPAVLECVALTLTDAMYTQRLVAVVVAPQGLDDVALRARCTRELGPPLTPAAVVVVDSLPHNAGGKILRQEVPALLERQLLASTAATR
jgi:acyl-coenzyme A synthetase/AMP-(fatty) acid ligase